MALTIGIVGLPNVGKSTLFNALTRAQVLAANYPFATIEPNVGVVPLPDPRLQILAAIFSSDRILPATVSFVDIAGIVKGASEGEGLGNKFLANIREAEAICQVTRVFADPDVVHVDGRVSPKDDIETVNTELILADLQTLEKAVPRLEKDVRAKKADAALLEAAVGAQKLLEAGETLFAGAAAAKLDLDRLSELQLLTAKPFIYVFNTDDAGLADTAMQAELREFVAPADAIFLDAKFESELVELEPDEAKEMLAENGQDEAGLDQLARVGFHTLGLQTYLTAGPKESRAWTIHRGWTAPQAAGVIHTDFQRGFIKAEVIGFEDLVDAGSVPAARAAGKARVEGSRERILPKKSVHRFRFIDLLRLFAALMVVGYHYFALAPSEIWGTRYHEIPATVSRISAYGALGVDLFFIISGFVITLSLSNRSTKEFIASRVARLFPAYLVAVALVLLLPRQLEALHPSKLPGYLVNFFMLQTPLGVAPLSGVYWTLWVEATFYILMAILARRGGLTYGKLMAVAFFWPLAGLYAQNLGLGSVATLLQANNAPLFAGGICIYALYRYGGSLLTWSLLAVDVGLSTWTVTSGGYLLAMEQNTGQKLSITAAIALIVSFYAAVYFASNSSLRSRGWKVLTTAGALTDPLYLIHEEWGWFAISIAPKNLSPVVVAPFVCALAIAAAYMIQRFVERPLTPKVRRAIAASFEHADSRVLPPR